MNNVRPKRTIHKRTLLKIFRVIIKSITNIQLYPYKTYITQFVSYDSFNQRDEILKNYTDDIKILIPILCVNTESKKKENLS